MKLSFFGAAREVTGSCHFLDVGGVKIFIDCGLPQGPDEGLEFRFPVPAAVVDFVLLTHAHIDHAGRLPLLKKQGFRGQIYATSATCDLSSIMLKDSAYIQETEAEWENRKRLRLGQELIEPLYTLEDAVNVLEDFVSCSYGQLIDLTPDIQIRFNDIGHLLGSACIEVMAREEKEFRKLVFSGDIGNRKLPLLKAPTFLKEADYIIMESTYGDRIHEVPDDYVANLAAVIERTFDRGGNVVIPAFAVGRTQEILYYIRQIKERQLVKGHGNFLVYVDSPMANEATTVFMRHQDCYAEEACDLLDKGINPITFDGLKLAITPDESKAINFIKQPVVIISSSGMCDAGRIRHHLKHNLWREESTVIFTGFQAKGSVGRALLEGVGELKLFGEVVSVDAEIVQLNGTSGHADQDFLIEWAANFKPSLTRFFIVHGEAYASQTFANLLEDKLKCQTTVPNYASSWELVSDKEEEVGFVKRPLVRKTRKAGGVSRTYSRLLAVQQRLETVIVAMQGRENSEIAKLADQLIVLCTKWEKTKRRNKAAEKPKVVKRKKGKI